MDILLFGITKDIVGKSRLSIEQNEAITVLQLKEKLIGQFPKFKDLSSLSVAVNNNYAQDNSLINIGDEIALIPPVSGG